MANARRSFTSNQVFIGLPWKTVKAKYETAINKLRTSSPLSFTIVGRGDTQDAEDLLALIKAKIQNSSYAIFDATDGNANVSLEYGYAEALDLPRALYFSGRKHPAKNKEQPIISDLAGKKRQPYKTQAQLLALLKAFSRDHAYTKRFERFLSKHGVRKQKGERKRLRALALKIIHIADGQETVRRDDVLQNLLADQSSYTKKEVVAMIKAMNSSGLITSTQGQHSRINIE